MLILSFLDHLDLLYVFVLFSHFFQGLQGLGQVVAPVPDVSVPGQAAHHVQALQHVHNVIDAPALHVCRGKDEPDISATLNMFTHALTAAQIPVLPLDIILNHFCQFSVTKISENSPRRSCQQGKQFIYGRTCCFRVILGFQHSSRKKTYCCQKSHYMGFNPALEKTEHF